MASENSAGGIAYTARGVKYGAINYSGLIGGGGGGDPPAGGGGTATKRATPTTLQRLFPSGILLRLFPQE